MNAQSYPKRIVATLAILVAGFVAISYTYQAAQGRENYYFANSSSVPAVAATPTPTRMPNGPTLYVSYREGAPGSVFTLTGLQFPAGEQVSIWINSHFIVAMEAVGGSSNWFIFHLNTAYANEGLYIVTAQTQSVVTRESFFLDSYEPVREPITGPIFDTAPVFSVPVNIAFTSQSFLPLIIKSP